MLAITLPVLLKSEINFRRGKRDGKTNRYSKDNRLLRTENYKNGFLEGPTKEFYKDFAKSFIDSNWINEWWERYVYLRGRKSIK